MNIKHHPILLCERDVCAIETLFSTNRGAMASDGKRVVFGTKGQHCRRDKIGAVSRERASLCEV